MKIQLIVIILVIFANIAEASQFDDFNNYIKSNDLINAKRIIDNWEKDINSDPQYYICQFNYHVNISRTEGIGIQKNIPNVEKTLQITDPKTGEVKGYFAPKVAYDKEKIKVAIDYINQGIQKFPDHYEMRFGLLWLYKEIDNFNDYLNTMNTSLKFLKKNNPKYIYWNNNDKIDNVNEFIIETVQGNFSKLIKEKKPSMPKEFISKYSDLMINYFPNHKYGYSNKGAYYYQNSDLKKANEYFIKAFNIDPKDDLIAFNIGYCYKQQNDFENAKIYFKKVIEISKNNYFIDGAKKQIEQLENIPKK